MNEEDIKNLSEIIELCEEEINNNDENVTAILDLADLKSLRNLINRNRGLDALKNSCPAIPTTGIECDLKKQLKELEEKDKEIEKLKKENEHWKNGFKRELEDNRKNTCELLKQDLIIRKKDRQIDLMAEHIQNGCDFDNRIKTKEDIKQYFASKAEKE